MTKKHMIEVEAPEFEGYEFVRMGLATKGDWVLACVAGTHPYLWDKAHTSGCPHWVYRKVEPLPIHKLQWAKCSDKRFLEMPVDTIFVKRAAAAAEYMFFVVKPHQTFRSSSLGLFPMNCNLDGEFAIIE